MATVPSSTSNMMVDWHDVVVTFSTASCVGTTPSISAPVSLEAPLFVLVFLVYILSQIFISPKFGLSVGRLDV